MEFLILESREGSGYEDSATSYEFPKRYLSQFERASEDGQVALIYEPKRQGGRQGFVAWAIVSGKPRPVGPGMFAVDFSGGWMSFDRVVPFSSGGVPAEDRLRSLEPRQYGASLQGKAVRRLPAANAVDILSRGMEPVTNDLFWHDGLVGSAPSLEDRQRSFVSRLERDARFRDGVLDTFDFSCCITGLSAGRVPASRLGGLIEAAHIRPVAAGGPDLTLNGIALSPTVHRLFDAGLFTLRTNGDGFEVQTSPLLRPEMTHGTRGTVLRIEDKLPIRLPRMAQDRPSREFVEYHRSKVFRASA